jgi:putative Holliday junction resolvase
MKQSEQYKGKRLAGIDFGKKRVGLAICDELHITVTPKLVLDYTSPNFWDQILRFFTDERVSVIILGIPYRHDNSETELMQEIKEFAEQLYEKTNMEVILRDEAFTSVEAVSTMISIGKKKKDRSRKGSKDMIAAAIILRDFLENA